MVDLKMIKLSKDIIYEKINDYIANPDISIIINYSYFFFFKGAITKYFDINQIVTDVILGPLSTFDRLLFILYLSAKLSNQTSAINK